VVLRAFALFGATVGCLSRRAGVGHFSDHAGGMIRFSRFRVSGDTDYYSRLAQVACGDEPPATP
jgi:hypothetical protein